MMPKSVKRFSDDIMLLFDLEGTCRLKTKKPPGMAAVRILLLQSSDRAQSSRRQRAPKVPICGGQVDHAIHIVDAEALVTCPDEAAIVIQSRDQKVQFQNLRNPSYCVLPR
ncbi:MAG: hypothetical protein EOS03_18690 [Mesorhizobium sp.]|nr:MAG: hypothetical protein EOS03_18690 [Mesorhizobium sp.]